MIISKNEYEWVEIVNSGEQICEIEILPNVKS